MILTGDEIRREAAAGRILIDPFDDSCVNPNSYNYHLGDTLLHLDSARSYDLSTGCSTQVPAKIPEAGITLEPGQLYLSHTRERLGSPHYVTSLIGKSSMGRLGLFLQLAADLGHQGEVHHWTLELRPCLRVRLYAGMVIGQVSFWRPRGAQTRSGGYYAGFDRPQVSRGIR